MSAQTSSGAAPQPTAEPSSFRSLSHQTAQFFAPLQREIDRAVADFGRGLDRLDMFAPVPNVDYAETKDGIEITAELPGLTKKDIKVTFEDDVLTLAGEKRAEQKREGKDYRFVERRFGAFARSIPLPRGVDAAQLKAEMKDGLLRITAPNPDNGDSRKIEVTVA